MSIRSQLRVKTSIPSQSCRGGTQEEAQIAVKKYLWSPTMSRESVVGWSRSFTILHRQVPVGALSFGKIQVYSQLTFCYALAIDDPISNHIHDALEAFESWINLGTRNTAGPTHSFCLAFLVLLLLWTTGTALALLLSLHHFSILLLDILIQQFLRSIYLTL